MNFEVGQRVKFLSTKSMLPCYSKTTYGIILDIENTTVRVKLPEAFDETQLIYISDLEAFEAETPRNYMSTLETILVYTTIIGVIPLIAMTFVLVATMFIEILTGVELTKILHPYFGGL